MAFLECAEGLLVRLALIYWALSFVVLVFRLVWPDFQRLAAYGGHSGTLQSDTTSHTAHDSAVAGVGDNLKKTNCRSAKTWPSLLIAALQASPLGTVTVTRKQSFTSFYLTGVFTGVLLLLVHLFKYKRSATPTPLYPACLTAVPLLLFLFHCGVRLVETRCVQRFRQDDSVTLFAAVAGCTFYAMASISSAVPPAFLADLSTRWMSHSTNIQLIILAGAVAHVSVQAVQVMVHTILAGLRWQTEKTRQKEAEAQDLEEGLWRYVRAGLLSTAKSKGETSNDHFDKRYALRGAWRSYHFPYLHHPLFQHVLNPHYTCEVLLYGVNTAVLALCILPHPLHSVRTVEEEEMLWRWVCAPMALLSVAASAGVTLFTLLNLGITAAGHRRFWNASNAVRHEVAGVLESLLSASAEVGKMERLPAELIDVAAWMLDEDLAEEVLPRWNVIPYVW